MIIDENYFITFDTHNVTLNYQKVSDQLNKKGENVVTKRSSHHGSVRQALIAFLNSAVKDERDCTDVIDLLARMDTIEDKINKFIAQHSTEK